jgi:hypothetical protein
MFLTDKLFSNGFERKDEKQWQSADDNFRQARLNYFNRKKKKFCQSRREENLHDENQIDHIICTQTDSQFTTTRSSISNKIIGNGDDRSKKDEIKSFIVNDDSKPFDEIRKVCDQFEWNTVKNDANVVLLTRYFISNKRICSISDIDLDLSYKHMCQYGE